MKNNQINTIKQRLCEDLKKILLDRLDISRYPDEILLAIVKNYFNAVDPSGIIPIVEEDFKNHIDDVRRLKTNRNEWDANHMFLL